MGNTRSRTGDRPTLSNGTRTVYIEQVAGRASRHRYYWSVVRHLSDDKRKGHSGWTRTAWGARRKCARIVFRLERQS
jgi:hypothetical protein